MATVYLAKDLKRRRDVAIKVLKPDVAAAIAHDRFLLEIEIAAQLNHPHIVALFDSGFENDTLYYVMPCIKGESLRAHLNRLKTLPLEEALRLTREIASALGHAHRNGIVHRDVKPENVLLADGIAVVADFGIARAMTAAADPEAAGFTKSGLVVGTPHYMSPEQATGDGVDGRSDIYSLACVLFEMLAGRPPFPGTQALTVSPRTSLRRLPPSGQALCLAVQQVDAGLQDTFSVARGACLLRDFLERFSPGSNNSIDMILLWGSLCVRSSRSFYKCFYCRAVLVAT